VLDDPKKVDAVQVTSQTLEELLGGDLDGMWSRWQESSRVRIPRSVLSRRKSRRFIGWSVSSWPVS